ncbi:hypothetical protein [Amycolatopsis sp. 195334CR]|uniref:hypothetical protein n=1 Tax=Amycolatopsis sp. 195334CR TaxID=2814588 RepID=UPI001A8EAC6D|nr:hypothetical protein [Amycolatopsis sp. 195334CR]MBN6038624.1 hypothetical protein [Amycolatopsis sp. 195334CR]
MDLNRALSIIDSPALLRGQSDDALLHRVTEAAEFVPSDKALSPARGLHGGIRLRPAEALHQLSYVTQPRYHANLLDFYAQWALTRYVGFFDHEEADKSIPPGLTVSEAGRRIVGNQRRVTSEEMGIAFGAVLATRWLQRTVGARVPISIVDIDAALDDRVIYAGGARQVVRKVATTRPDYLLIAQDPSATHRFVIRTLECKGTKTRSHAVKQIAKALTQLGGVSVGGRVPTGLATSVIPNDRMSYLALDPDEGDELSHVVDPATIEQSRGFRLTDDVADWSPTALAAASVRAAWATLADFGGNLGALEQWAPTVMLDRLDRQSRDRTDFDTPYGLARGTRVTFTFAGRSFTVRYGIDAAIDRQLSNGSAGTITEAQAAFARRLSQQDRPVEAGSGESYSATADGSIFAIRID